jgi:hypothetical protein
MVDAMSTRLLVLFLMLLTACSSPDGGGPGPGAGDDDDGDDDDDGVPIPEADPDEVEIRSGELTLPPSAEIVWCFFGTWEGGDVGIDRVSLFRHPMSHHLLLKSVPEDDPTPDGTLVDCTEPTEAMSGYSSFLEGYALPTDGEDGEQHPEDEIEDYEGDLEEEGWMDLPEGMGVRLEAGARYMIDAHYINVSEEEITTEAIFRLHTVDPDDVDSWVGSYNPHAQELQLPPNAITSRENTCVWDQGTSVLSVGAHMHEYGHAYSVDWHKPDGTVRRLLNLDEWSIEYFREPEVVEFFPGEIVVEPGDWFTTTCTWNNTTDEVLDYPDEMCTTFGVAAPLEQSFECFGGVIGGE